MLTRSPLAGERRSPLGFIQPALLTPAAKVPTCAGWIHELKHDGIRLIARKDGPQVRLWSRYAFDLLAVDGEDLRPLPLLARRERLRALLEAADDPGLRFSEHMEGQDGEACSATRVGLGSKASCRRSLSILPLRPAQFVAQDQEPWL